MSKAQIEQGFKDLVDSMRDGYQMCLQEIKLIGDMLEAVEKKVGISKKTTASNDLQLTSSAQHKRGHEIRVSNETSPKITGRRVTRKSIREQN